jgi:hypothetical protein
VLLQVFTHEPQCAASFARFTSQPSAGLPLQSAKPGLHAAMPQPPELHAPTAFAGLHARPQPPQFAADVDTLVSQPSVALLLQSAKPALHAMPQMPPLHAGEPPAELHTTPQPPQFAGSLNAFTSQPSAAAPLQSKWPA